MPAIGAAWADGSFAGDSFAAGAWSQVPAVSGDVPHRVTLTPSQDPPFNEQTHFVLSMSFVDMGGVGYIPSTLSVRVDDFESLQGLLAPTAVTPAAQVDYTVPAEALTIVNASQPFETHVLTVTTNEGLSTERNERYDMVVLNSPFVS